MHIASLAAHTTLNIYKPMEISIERSPQYWCPNEESNSEPSDYENDALTARPQGGLEIQIKVKVVWRQVEKLSMCRAKVEEVKYPMTGEYVDDSKEILKELGGLDEDDGDDEDDEELGELEEDENGTTEEHDIQIID